MAQKLEAIGSTDGFTFDDGSDHVGVSKIHVGGGLQGIHYIEFEYVKSGQPKFGELVGRRHIGFIETFEINHLKDEYLESVEGYYDQESGYIQGLQFKTNFKISELIGYDKGNPFALEVKGKNITGFHGNMLTNKNIISLGAYFTSINPNIMEVKGSKRGQPWDDGADHDGLTKIHVRGGSEGIQYIQFDYVKNGKPQYGLIHGLSGSGFTQTFEIDHTNNEHLVYVEGYYDDASGVIQALRFKTNLKTSDMLGYEKGKKFLLAEKGKRIIGFHGNADKNLTSIGAYFTTVSLVKSECHGGREGIYWDDGVFESIKTVYVNYDTNNVKSIMFHYHNQTVVKRQHGWHSILEDGVEKFELDYPNEVITLVEGTFKRFGPDKTRVTSLIFKSSEGRTSPTFGVVSGTKFVLESKGKVVVGFHGRHLYSDLVAIGAYYALMPPPPTAEKLRPQGGLRGVSWDDGVYEGVRKLYVGQGDNGVSFLKVVYGKDTQIVIGEDHGDKTPLEVKELEIEYPSEYITSVDGYYDQVIGSEVEVITMLRFTTNIRKSIAVGFESTSSFVLHKQGYKIVGFHGKACNMINQLGVHVVPFNE